LRSDQQKILGGRHGFTKCPVLGFYSFTARKSRKIFASTAAKLPVVRLHISVSQKIIKTQDKTLSTNNFKLHFE
jgi:hypothetical protein